MCLDLISGIMIVKIQLYLLCKVFNRIYLFIKPKVFRNYKQIPMLFDLINIDLHFS